MTETVTDRAETRLQNTILNSLVGYRLRRAQLAYFENFRVTCAEEGITPGLFGILAIVLENPGLTQSAVAQALDTDRSAMVAALDKLEKLELIERRPAANDRRSYALFMTPGGTEFTHSLHRKVLAHEAHFEQIMQPGERAQLLDLLTRMIELER